MKRFSLFALVVLLIGCTNDASQDEQLVDRLPIKINFEKSRANDTAFESGDQVGLYVVNYDGSMAGTLTSTENHINNACFTLSTDWRAEEELYWKDASTKADFYAYYPYGNPTDISAYPFSVNTDQSAEADYWASDFLWGKRSGVAPTKSAVTITTEHLLSNALVYINAGEGYTAEELATADIEVKICNIKNSATINLATGVATATGSVTEITPWNTGAYYRAMIVPQTVSSDTNLVSVKINGKEYTFATDITFAAGTQHKIEVTISAPSNGLVANFSIKEWSVDDNIYSGEAIINPGAPMPANNEIWYTATEKVEPYKNDRFGANIVSNEWDETTSKGVITFDANVTSIGDWAFSRCSLTSITIPDSVTSIGVYAFYSCRLLTSITIPDSVTSIGGCAFSECSSLKAFYGKFASADNRCLIVDGVLTSFAPVGLTEYSIPGSVTSIGECAFAGCIDLTSVTIPNSVTSIGSRAFSRCSLTSITIPDSVTSFGNLAFSECLYMTSFYGKFASEDNCCLIVDGVLYSFAVGCDLTEYTIPNGVTEIGKNAFYSGYFLTNVTIPDSVTLIENSAFFNCISLTSVTIPDSVTAIGDEAFRNCTSLTSVAIPDSVTSIGDEAFRNCTSLTSVAIPDSVTSIGDEAFRNCTSLTSVTIPNSVTSIGEYAFSGCTGELIVNCNICGYKNGQNVYGANILNGYSPFYNSKFEKITIGNSVTSIGYGAFKGSKSLRSITILDSVTSIGNSAFSGCTSLTDTYVNITDLAAYAISNNTYRIPGNKHLLVNDKEVTELVIPDSVTEIGGSAFSGCTSLTSATIGNSVTSIGNSAFRKCTSLTSVTIPDSVTSIGGSAFEDCTSLTSVYCKPTTPPTGDGSMFFNNASDRKIYVQAASVEAYKAADGWKNYADYIEGYDF